MFDDDDGVAKIAKVDEGTQQALVVALMQTNGRFVEDIHYAHKTCTDLTGQPDSLCFAP